MSYRPHGSFTKRLHVLDRKLGCHLNTEIERWVITYKRATGQPVPIWTVETAHGGYREPDERDINLLKQSDMNNQSVDDMLLRASKHSADVRAISEIQRRNNIYAMTQDSKYQLKRAYGKINNPGGKGDRHVRQLTPKPKGKVFK